MAKPADETAFQKAKGKRFPSGMPKEAIYPLARWRQTRGGYFEFSQDEDGKVTKASFHPSGQARIEYPDGSVVNVSPGQVSYEAEGLQWTARSHADFDVGGHLKLAVSGGLEAQVAGDGEVTVGGTTTVNLMGDAAVAVNGNANIAVKGNANLDTNGKMALRSKGGMSLGTDGTLSMQASAIKMQPDGDGAPGYRMKG